MVRVPEPPGRSLSLTDLAVEANGQVLVAGSAFTPPPPGTAGEIEDGSAFLARYTEDGQLDRSFGKEGVLVSDLGLPPPQTIGLPQAPPQVRIVGIAVDGRNRIVLTGLRTWLVGPCRSFTGVRYQEGFAVRLLEDGTLDTGFGDGGRTLFPGLEKIEPPVLHRSSGKIYVSGTAWNGCNPVSNPRFLTRLGPSGDIDLAFAESGALRLPDPSPRTWSSLAVDRSGRALLLDHRYVQRTGKAPGHLVAYVRRVLPSGDLDQRFGAQGATVLRPPRGHSLTAYTLAVEPAGRIVLAGTSWPVRAGATPNSFLLGRLRANGAVDRRFGSKGRVRTRFGKRSQAAATGLILLPRGRILLAGTLMRPSFPHREGLAFARYLSR